MIFKVAYEIKLQIRELSLLNTIWNNFRISVVMFKLGDKEMKQDLQNLHNNTFCP